MPINLLSAGGGTTTLTTASSASNYTITLPATTGTMALTSGVVSSLNGQTGAITNTDYGAIGSYVMAGANGGSTTAGSTYAGSTLVRQTTSLGNGYAGYILVQKGATTSLGLTGTWRCMGTSVSDATYYGLDLFVRIS